MKISTKGRYAVRLMLDVAIHGMDKNVSMRDVAERQNISIKYLEQIVALLNKAGYLETARGNNGGYKLAKSPEQYKIGDILRKTEGDLAPIACVSGEECCRKENCKTFSFWQGLDNVINEYVDSKTLADLIR